MPIDTRDWYRKPHPPSCSCVECLKGMHGKWESHSVLCTCEECMIHKFPNKFMKRREKNNNGQHI
jgi:hypothetical protein